MDILEVRQYIILMILFNYQDKKGQESLAKAIQCTTSPLAFRYHRDLLWSKICKENQDYPEQSLKSSTKEEGTSLRSELEAQRLVPLTLSDATGAYSYILKQKKKHQSQEFREIDSINGEKLELLQELYEVYLMLLQYWIKLIESLNITDSVIPWMISLTSVDPNILTDAGSNFEVMHKLHLENNNTFAAPIIEYYFRLQKIGIKKEKKKKHSFEVKEIKASYVTMNGKKSSTPTSWNGVLTNGQSFFMIRENNKKKAIAIAVGNSMTDAMTNLKHMKYTSKSCTDVTSINHVMAALDMVVIKEGEKNEDNTDKYEFVKSECNLTEKGRRIRDLREAMKNNKIELWR